MSCLLLQCYDPASEGARPRFRFLGSVSRESGTITCLRKSEPTSRRIQIARSRSGFHESPDPVSRSPAIATHCTDPASACSPYPLFHCNVMSASHMKQITLSNSTFALAMSKVPPPHAREDEFQMFCSMLSIELARDLFLCHAFKLTEHS